jgi:RNA-directed DNA polymerase
MQYRTSRQKVTGLVVNSKVNVTDEYYRNARVMCHSLFQTGSYIRKSSDPTGSGDPITSLGPLQGILSHIHHIKNSADRRKAVEKKQHPTAFRELYQRFIFYQNFVNLQQPIIILEGKTDRIYLKCAIRSLVDRYPTLGVVENEIFRPLVSFFNYINKVHDVLDLTGGSGSIKIFIARYRHFASSFKHAPLRHPVIILIDNDDGATDIFGVCKQYAPSLNHASPDAFFYLTDNLYMIKTPGLRGSVKSCIEDFFPAAIKKTELDGKVFNPHKEHNADGEYGKMAFAEHVIRPNADKIDFSNFAEILGRIVAVIDHYKPAGE